MSQVPHPAAMPEPRVHGFNHPVVEEFRANEGRVGGPFEGGDLLLLTTVGARTGLEQTSPLAYIRDGARLLVVGSAGGSPAHPAWYRNIVAHPMARVEIGSETYAVVAVPTEGVERDRLFERIVAAAPGFADYQAKVTRALPVVALERSYDDGAQEATNLAEKLVEIHDWLRHQLRDVRRESDAYFAGPNRAKIGLNLQIRQYCLAFCESLHVHHTGEDEGVLPEMKRQHPELSEQIDRLREEHRTVARIKGDLEALMADIESADPEKFRYELKKMTIELEAHLDYEEETLIPPLSAIPFPPY